VLQEREFERVGGTQTLKVDVRFVAATHRDLEAMVAKGEFREDLFYRLHVVSLRVPPLRDRGADIGALASHFVRVLGEANDKPRLSIDADALALLQAYAWPGNVRQLQNMMERLVVLGDGPVIRKEDVERELPSNASRPNTLSQGASSLDAHRRDAERDALKSALVGAKNNRTQAARLLNVSRRTLYNKLKEHDLA